MFTIINEDTVVNNRGEVLAQKVYGEWQTKDADVLNFLAGEDKPKKKTKPKAKATPDPVLERARDENGHFIADDPTTEVNEAWVVKTAKKIVGKK